MFPKLQQKGRFFAYLRSLQQKLLKCRQMEAGSRQKKQFLFKAVPKEVFFGFNICSLKTIFRDFEIATNCDKIMYAGIVTHRCLEQTIWWKHKKDVCGTYLVFAELLVYWQ